MGSGEARWLRVTVLLGAAACAPPAAEDVEVVSGTGYVTLTRALPDEVAPGDVLGVTVGDVPAARVAVEDGVIAFMPQGGPPGEVSVVLETRGGPVALAGMAYAPPVDPLFDRIAGLGASFSMGVQDGAGTPRAQLLGPLFQLARLARAPFRLPLFRDGWVNPLGVDIVGPAPRCQIPDIGDAVGNDLLAAFVRAGNAGDDLSAMRETPWVEVQNVAVGNLRLADVVHGPDPLDPLRSLFFYLSLAPEASRLGDALGPSPLERVEAMQPTLILTTDLYGNDVLGPLVAGAEVALERLTPDAEVRADLEAFVTRTAATGAEVFIANASDPTALPRPAAAGFDPDDVATVAAAAVRFNGILTELASAHANVHVVDFAGCVAEVFDAGVPLGDVTLDVTPLGGLVSFDGVHLSDVGYAVVAACFAEAIEGATGVALPEPDLHALLANSPHAPAAIRAAGREPTDCAMP
jgi:hypothetical protein